MEATRSPSGGILLVLSCSSETQTRRQLSVLRAWSKPKARRPSNQKAHSLNLGLAALPSSPSPSQGTHLWMWHFQRFFSSACVLQLGGSCSSQYNLRWRCLLPWATVMSLVRCFHSADVMGWATWMKGLELPTGSRPRFQTAQVDPVHLVGTTK